MTAISRRPYFPREDRHFRGPRINDQIRITPIRLINENEENVGEVPTYEALQRARELGLDLVEMAADVRPPVCRIMDYGKYKYEQSKKDKANKSKSKTAELKEVRMGRSMKIDPHDVAIRLKQAREFLLEGHKVQIVQNFRGREVQHRDRGNVRMQEIIAALGDIAKVEVPARLMGKRMSMILGPDKAKIDQLKRRQPAKSSEGSKGGETAAKPADAKAAEPAKPTVVVRERTPARPATPASTA